MLNHPELAERTSVGSVPFPARLNDSMSLLQSQSVCLYFYSFHILWLFHFTV